MARKGKHLGELSQEGLWDEMNYELHYYRHETWQDGVRWIPGPGRHVGQDWEGTVFQRDGRGGWIRT
jgi:hypothetical protein